MRSATVLLLLVILGVHCDVPEPIQAVVNVIYNDANSIYTSIEDKSEGDNEIEINGDIAAAAEAEGQETLLSDVTSSHRFRRNAFLQTPSNLIINDFRVSQRCRGILLEWTPPSIPMIPKGVYRNHEFHYYNVYRSNTFFTDVSSLTPIASGAKYASLRNMSRLSWLDRNPITNSQAWYAITIYTATGKEYKTVSATQATFIGALGASGPRIPLVPQYVKGRILHHAVAFNKPGNRYLIVYDVDTNGDNKPDRLHAVQVDASGAVIGGNALDISATLNGQQGWPQVAYNPISNQYTVLYKVVTPQIAGGMPCLVAQRMTSTITRKVTNPSLVLTANVINNGKKSFVPLDNHKIKFNPATGGYVVLSEVVETSSKRATVVQLLNANAASQKVIKLFNSNLNARNGDVFVDSRRNDIYIAGLIPSKAINNRKLAEKYAYLVTKLNGTLGVPNYGKIFLIAGTSNVIFSTLTGFYSKKKDRLCLYWSTMSPNQQGIRYAEVIISQEKRIEGEPQPDGDYHVGCKSTSRQRKPSAAEFEANGAQLLFWEEVQSRKWKVNGELIKNGLLQFKGLQQSNPIVVANGNNNGGLVVWQELIKAGQINVFAQHVKPIAHQCASGCQSDETCLKENTCVQQLTSKNPCSIRNGGCSHKCLLTESTKGISAVCACPFGMKLAAQGKACIKKAPSRSVYSIFIGSTNLIWHMTYYTDASVTFKLLPVKLQSIVAMAFDKNKKKLYFSDVDAKVIMRCDLNGKNYENVLSGVTSDGLTIDSKNQRLYWSDFAKKTIETMKLDGSNRKVLANTNIEKPRAIELALVNGALYLYWSDWGTVAKIERIKLDSSGTSVIRRENVLANGLLWPNAIAIENNRLYIGDARKDQIESLDIQTKQRRKLASSSHPYDIQLKNESIYWSDWQGTVFQANKFQSPLRPKILIANLKRPTGFVLIDDIGTGGAVCPDPGTPVNGQRLLGTGMTSGSTIAFSCNSNFVMNGQAAIKCLDTGKWSHKLPTCSAAGCPQLTRHKNGNIFVTGLMVGDAIVHTCNPGYKMIGSKVRRCQTDGKWSGAAVKCFVLPVFTKRPQNHTVAVGKSVVLRCDASGDDIKIQWIKNDKPLTSKDSDLRVFIFEKSIVLSEVRFSDAAVFTCKVSNQAGAITSQAVINVLGTRISKCGKRKFSTRQRISGGRIAGEGSHPWIVMFYDNRKKEMFCGGSLISEKWIVTAAHCFEGIVSPKEFVVILGKSHRLKADPHQQTINAKAIYKHGSFSPKTYDSDIALVQLEKDAMITDYVIPICLPYDDQDFKLSNTLTLVTIAGWGSKNEKQQINQKLAKKLREMEIPIVSHSECQSKMQHPVTKNMICAGDRSGTDACKGDSGGPMEALNYKTQKHVLVGVVSWGDGCGKTDSYGVYTKVQNYMAWINTQIKKA